MSHATFAAIHAAMAEENLRRWEDGLCDANGGAASCPCKRHTIARCAAYTEAPSILEVDVDDPTFVSAYQVALAEVRADEEERRRRTAAHIALERLRGRVRK